MLKSIPLNVWHEINIQMKNVLVFICRNNCLLCAKWIKKIRNIFYGEKCVFFSFTRHTHTLWIWTVDNDEQPQEAKVTIVQWIPNKENITWLWHKCKYHCQKGKNSLNWVSILRFHTSDNRNLHSILLRRTEIIRYNLWECWTKWTPIFLLLFDPFFYCYEKKKHPA